MSQERLFFLDRLRFFTIFLVICLHAAMTYMVFVPGWWYVIDGESRLFFTLLVLWLDVFVMPSMFFIAGYFAVPSLLKRNRIKFFKRKLARIGIPWILGSILVAPLLAYRSWISLKLPTKGFLHFLEHDFWGPIYQQGPYWFLGVLLLFFAILSLCWPILERNGIARRTGKHSNPGLPAFLIFWMATGLTFFACNLYWPIDTWIHPGYIFVFQPLRFIPYFLTFCFGIFAWKQKWFFEGFFCPSPFFWIPLATVVGGLFLAMKMATNVQSSFSLKLVNALLHNGFSLAALMGLLGSFSRFRTSSDGVRESLGRKAYSVYWVHMPVIMFFAWLLLPLSLSPYMKFLILVGPGTGVCLFLAGYLRKIPRLGGYF